MTKNILESIVLILVAITFAMILTKPKYDEYKTQKGLVEQKQVELQTSEDYFKSLERISAELKNYGPGIAKVESALPDDPNAAELTNFLEVTAAQNGLIIKNLNYSLKTPEEASNAPEASNTPISVDAQESQKNQQSSQKIQTQELNLAVSGPYQAWKDFSNRIEKSSRLLEIDNVVMSTNLNGTGAQTEEAATQSAINPILDYTVKLIFHSY